MWPCSVGKSGPIAKGWPPKDELGDGHTCIVITPLENDHHTPPSTCHAQSIDGLCSVVMYLPAMVRSELLLCRRSLEGDPSQRCDM